TVALETIWCSDGRTSGWWGGEITAAVNWDLPRLLTILVPPSCLQQVLWRAERSFPWQWVGAILLPCAPMAPLPLGELMTAGSLGTTPRQVGASPWLWIGKVRLRGNG